ncbi:pyridoxamine 5'-phosphate oxidase family protein [Thermomonospora curvata]|uniref:Pyridoxamine 5'-phosphate oxidase-related FMN-binding protein n=1 Tax=Thermomonospora curvata (strain ATCC 19995 / DSM 43183 / JCM 3096 / KCTC 9072 / NBRC 15933 / NCIMB 10081 / Henssen B9) TaxID=471852 RepID=D1ADC7_THECD|nr:pyridoxamine 5'-phosphate oxidase family protein [Thermomonospora curvata]ACY95637.1 pyridoxamine 5'-phosphate oxidase-related FMN- binding protein [Thermomonospora curvata DSM 43183]
MTIKEPVTELNPAFSSATATATEWSQGEATLAEAELYWLATVRPDGRPHVTPLLGVWLDQALHFVTGPQERKARNLAANPHCVLLTGRNSLREGLDVVVEGDAERVDDEAYLRRLAGAFAGKYGPQWRLQVQEGALRRSEGGRVWAFKVTPVKAFGFGKGETYSQTRWRFQPRPAG